MLLHIDCRGNNEKRIAVFVCCVLVVRIMYAHHVCPSSSQQGIWKKLMF